jgi:hypothetical protein
LEETADPSAPLRFNPAFVLFVSVVVKPHATGKCAKLCA